VILTTWRWTCGSRTEALSFTGTTNWLWLFGLMMVEHESIDGHNGIWLPFGHQLERDADLLLLRKSDGSYVAAFQTPSK
jgi:hypothetical protein